VREVARHSWTSPEARSNDLLYASTGDDGAIYVYTYPKGKLVSGLFNSGSSYGLCSDSSGNAFVTNDYAIYEYPHGAAGPSASLTNPFGATFSCSIDPTTGNLAAVTAHDAVVFQPGAHGWKQAKLFALTYPATGWCGYDASGNLFMSAEDSGGWFISELLKGKSAFKKTLIDRRFEPGNIQSDGKYVAIGDNVLIRRFKFIGTTGRQVSVRKLNGIERVFQFWIQGGTVTAAANQSGSYAVGLWPYPAGGNPQQFIEQHGTYGVTVSLAHSLR